jgi:hypothetical protein
MDIHRVDAKVQLCGKLAIVKSILEAERASKLMAIEDSALRKEPVEGGTGAYEYQPVAIAKLRKDVLAMLNGTPQVLAEACLSAIDKLRDEHGSAASEPRHPDIESGRPWRRLPPASRRNRLASI